MAVGKRQYDAVCRERERLLKEVAWYREAIHEFMQTTQQRGTKQSLIDNFMNGYTGRLKP